MLKSKFFYALLPLLSILLVGCSGFPISYQSENKRIEITDDIDLEYQRLVTPIIASLENIASDYSEDVLTLVQLYYRSFIGEFVIYGDYEYKGTTFFHSLDDFLVSPIQVFEISIEGFKYIILYSEYSIYSSYTEAYRPGIEVFKLNNNSYKQVSSSDEFCENNRCNIYFSYFNDLYSGIFHESFIALEEHTFKVNEIILSNIFKTYSSNYNNSIKLLSRYFQSIKLEYSLYGETISYLYGWNLGVYYDLEQLQIRYFRKRERECRPSISNCEYITTLSYDNILFDFQSNRVDHYETGTLSTYNLNLSLAAHQINTLQEELLAAQTYLQFQDTISTIQSEFGFDQSDILSLLAHQFL